MPFCLKNRVIVPVGFLDIWNDQLKMHLSVHQGVGYLRNAAVLANNQVLVKGVHGALRTRLRPMGVPQPKTQGSGQAFSAPGSK